MCCGRVGALTKLKDPTTMATTNRSRHFMTSLPGYGSTEANAELLKKLIPPNTLYIVGQDECSAAGHKHFQMVFGFKNARTLWAVRKLFPAELAPGIQACKNVYSVLEYCKKSETRVKDGYSLNLGTVPAKAANKEKKEKTDDMLRTAIAMETLEDAIKYIEDTDLSYFVRSRKSICEYLQSKFAKNNKRQYRAEDFTKPLIENKDGRTMVFVGPPGIGKTSFALAHFECPCLISTEGDWSNFNPATHDGIVLDDYSFAKWSVRNTLALLDREKGCSQNIKYGYVRIPEGFPLCITLNVESNLWPESAKESEIQAIQRRLLVIECRKDLRAGTSFPKPCIKKQRIILDDDEDEPPAKKTKINSNAKLEDVNFFITE